MKGLQPNGLNMQNQFKLELDINIKRISQDQKRKKPLTSGYINVHNELQMKLVWLSKLKSLYNCNGSLVLPSWPPRRQNHSFTGKHQYVSKWQWFKQHVVLFRMHELLHFRDQQDCELWSLYYVFICLEECSE